MFCMFSSHNNTFDCELQIAQEVNGFTAQRLQGLETNMNGCN